MIDLFALRLQEAMRFLKLFKGRCGRTTGQSPRPLYFRALETECTCGLGLLLIVCNEDQVGLKAFTKEACCGDMDRIEGLNDCRHRSRPPVP